MKRRSLPLWAELMIVFIACLALSSLISLRLLVTPGWVGMHHDWSPMPFPGQFKAWASDEFYGWAQLGIGLPSNYPNDWIILGLYSLVGMLVDAPLLSKLTLVLVPAVAAFGAYIVTRIDLKLPVFPCCAAAFLAATNPVIFNKIIAGQIAYLWGYALFPIWLIAYRSTTQRANTLVALRILAGIVAVVISSQIQFIVFIVITMILDAIASPKRKLFDGLFSPFATIACIVIAQSATFFSVSQSIGYLSHSIVDVPSLDWIRTNSATLMEAFALRGYVTHYFTNMYRLLPGIGWLLEPSGLIFSVILIFGAVVSWQNPRARLFPLLWIFGVFAMTGTNFPIPGVVPFLYGHVRAMQMFREVYHWAVLAEMGAAVLVAYALTGLPAVGKARTALTLVIVADVLLYFAPTFTGNWGGQMQVVQTSPLLRAYYEHLANSADENRVMWLPIDQPIMPPKGKFAGLDPMANTRPYSLWEYVLTSPVSTIALGLRNGDIRGLDRLLQYTAVDTIVLRKGFVSQIADYNYRRPPDADVTYVPDANKRGMQRLGWKIAHDDGAVTSYTSPQKNAIVSAASGLALISPIARLLPFAPAAFSPVGTNIPDAIDAAVIEQPDFDGMVALAAPKARNLLDAGIILDSADARISWAPIDVWWNYRYAFTQALDTSMVSIAPTLVPGQELLLGPVKKDTRVVVSFVESPFGGTLQIQTPDNRYIEYNTRASYSRLKTVIITARSKGQVTVRNLTGEQAIRHIFAFSPEEWQAARARLTSILSRTPNVRILLEGEHDFLAAADGIYSLQGVKKVDGRSVGSTVRLRPGVHSVTGDGSAVIIFRHPGTIPQGSVVDVVSSDNGNRFTGVAMPGTGIIRLRMSFSNGWKLDMPGAGHVDHLPGDFFMNAWTFPKVHAPTSFTIENETALKVAFMHRIATVALCALLSLALLLLVQRKRVAARVPATAMGE